MMLARRMVSYIKKKNLMSSNPVITLLLPAPVVFPE